MNNYEYSHNFTRYDCKKLQSVLPVFSLVVNQAGQNHPYKKPDKNFNYLYCHKIFVKKALLFKAMPFF